MELKFIPQSVPIFPRVFPPTLTMTNMSMNTHSHGLTEEHLYIAMEEMLEARRKNKTDHRSDRQLWSFLETPETDLEPGVRSRQRISRIRNPGYQYNTFL